MRLLINSKKILQEYLISKFEKEINKLLNSVENVEKLKKELNSIE